MTLTSYGYILFLVVAVTVHWSLPRTWRKGFLLAASYVFYCTWRWEFALLLAGSGLFNWYYARYVLPRAASARPLALGLVLNFLPLLFFKYTLFILTTAAALLQLGGWHWQPPAWNLALPVGISFFTLQAAAYLIDVAAGEAPFQRLSDFMLFQAFWPRLLAGPIVRAAEVCADFERPRALDYADVAAGCQRIVLGLFKKVVLADNLAPYVDMVFLPSAAPNFIDCMAGVLGFAMQVYFDFSAYSDIAIGAGRLLGYGSPENFNWPYLSRSPQDFWARWHITLSRWIRDYVFTPLTFATRARRGSALVWLLVAMSLCGLWHGAQWTFVLWGLWHGLLLVLGQTFLKSFFSARTGLRALAGMAVTFIAVQAGWLIFRAGSLAQACSMAAAIVTMKGHLRPAVLRENAVLFILLCLAGLLAAQLLHIRAARAGAEAPRTESLSWRLLKPPAYALMIVAVIVFADEAAGFVYFNF